MRPKQTAFQIIAESTRLCNVKLLHQGGSVAVYNPWDEETEEIHFGFYWFSGPLSVDGMREVNPTLLEKPEWILL